MRCCSPSLRPAAFPPPSPPPIRGRLCSRLHRYYAAVRLLASSTTASPLRLPVAARPRHGGLGEMRSPRFRRSPFIRNGVSDHGRAVAPRLTVRNMLPSTFVTASASAGLSLSRLNIPLHMIAVYASWPSSPAPTQHSLQGGSLLPYPDRTFTGWTAPASPGALQTDSKLGAKVSAKFSVKGKVLSSSRDPNNWWPVSLRSRRNRISIAQAHRDIRRQRSRNLQLGLHVLGSQPKQRRTNPAGSQAAGMSRQHQVLSRSATILKLAGNQDQHRRIPEDLETGPVKPQPAC